MNAATQLAILTAYVEANPAPPRPTLSDDEIATEDYWAGIGEARRDEALMPMSRGDEERRQNAYEHHLDRLGGSR